MPYRYGKRYYKKRSYRKRYRGRKLSTKRVYRNRSSRAQAGQIVALNKKINYVRKELAPDIQYFDSMMYSHSAVKSELQACYKSSMNMRTFSGHVNTDYSSDTTLGGYWAGLQQGSETINIKNIRFKVSLSKGNPSGYGYDGPLKLEFLVVQTTSQISVSSSVADQIFGHQPSGLNSNNIGYPLNAGFWRRFKILKRKFISIDNDIQNIKDVSFNIKPKYHKIPDLPNTSGTDFLVQNDLYVVYRLWGASATDNITGTVQYFFRVYFSHA